MGSTVTTTVAEMEAGSLKIQLVDDDGEELPGNWEFEWTGRDPLELAIYVITELSMKPWKWASRRTGKALLGPQRCRMYSARVGKVLKKELRTQTASTIARVIAQECLRPGQKAPDARAIAEVLAGKREPDWDAGPHESVPAMIRALRTALKEATTCEAGLQITWGSDD